MRNLGNRKMKLTTKMQIWKFWKLETWKARKPQSGKFEKLGKVENPVL